MGGGRAARAGAAPPWVGGVNIGAFRAPGDGTSKDFGLALSYQPLSRLGVRAGSESGTAYEMTQAELTAVAEAPLGTRLRLIGMAGGAHWSESPQRAARGPRLQSAARRGPIYRLARPWGVRLPYQHIIGRGALTQGLSSIRL